MNEYFRIKNQKRIYALEHNVPYELKTKKQWCVFKVFYNKGQGRYGKVILNVADGKWASSTDSGTWTSFDAAIEYAKKNNCAGVSFALTTQDNIFCVDLDDTILDDKSLSPLASELLEKSQNTYSEKSVSGKGIHIFFKTESDMSLYLTHSDTIECYGTAKFISMTGEKLNTASTIGDASYEFLKTVKKNLGEKPKIGIYGNQGVSKCSDSEVIAKIRRSKRAADFDRLWNGEDLCGDHSRSDYMLCGILAYFTDCDAAQMDRLFRQSGLYRPKWDRNYGRYTIDKVIERTPVSRYRKTNNDGENSSSK